MKLTRNDYTIASIENIIKANTKLVNEKQELEKELLEKENIITKVKEILQKYNDKENNYYVPISNIIKIIEGKEDEEDEDIFSII